MALKFALLALLRAGPLSGYELHKIFTESVGHVWHAPDSQIYPELKRMETAGFISGEEQPRGERGHRRVYHVTDAGNQAFVAWLSEPLDYARVRDPAHLKAAYLESAPPEARLAFLIEHARHHSELLQRWQDELTRLRSAHHPILERRLVGLSAEDRERTIAFKEFTYEGLVERARTEIRWAERGLELLKRVG